ncbi:MAG TPA: hypothetical protein VGF99_10950, partial [Myxococcota bacterium]
VAALSSSSLLVLACDDEKKPVEEPAKVAAPTPKAPDAPKAEALPTDAWLGKWVGVEGLALVIDKGPGGPGNYKLTISSMDGTTSHAGVADVDRIRFERNGTEYIRAGKGTDTGLKWLADKNNCLIIKEAEGFCR